MEKQLNKRSSHEKDYANPKKMYKLICDHVKSGDIAEVTGIISVYIQYSPLYSGMEEFAQAIGTTRQTLYRMLANQNVSMNLFFKAVERIFDDANESK